MNFFDDLLRDRESYAISCTRASFICLIEAIEDMDDIRFRDTDTRISNFYTIFAYIYIDTSRIWCELLCVRYDIPDRGHEEILIDDMFSLCLDVETDTRICIPVSLREEISDIHFFSFSDIVSCEEEECIDDMREFFQDRFCPSDTHISILW